MHQTGRNRITPTAIDEEIVRKVQEKKFVTAVSISEEYDISKRTVTRRLNEKGIYNRIPATQEILTNEHRLRRIRFCQENINRDWSKVVFSDEKTFKTNAGGKSVLWRPNNCRHVPEYVQKQHFSNKIACGFWGFITANGVGELCVTSSKMDGPEYSSILEEVYLPSMNIMYGEAAKDMVFMQDNASTHTCTFTREWLAKHPEIKLLEWPAKSPDLNPIENVWAIMVRNWKMSMRINLVNLQSEVQKRWNDLIGTEYVVNLYNSMPNRLRDVLQANGNWCKY